MVVVAVERRVPAQQNVRDDADRPHVAALVVLLVEDLWGNVVRGSDLGLHHVAGAVWGMGGGKRSKARSEVSC